MSATKIVVDGWCCDRVLGTGGFGMVQLWVHPPSGTKLAIKKCKWDVTKLTETQKNRWIREVKIMSQLQHPNIVRAIQVPFKFPHEDQFLPVLCMEYCRKGDLRKVLNKPENCCGIDEQEAVKVIRNISSAVKYLHNYAITHRDLKPENIVLQDEGNFITYKLIDLGYAKELGEASTSASIVGTLNYVAPELLWRKKYSCAVDYWSLGILFYEVITGSRPFLPNMPQPIAWMQHIKNKEYDDIRAYELNGSIVFGKDIEEPTQISRWLKERLVEWFRIVLQWDSRKRGKVCDDNGVLQLVVFNLLTYILSKETVRVFYASLHRIEAYEVSDDTTVAHLQKLIQNDSSVQVSEQVLTDYFGKPLIAERPLLSQIHDPMLFLFKKGDAILGDIPVANIPAPLGQMLGSLEYQLDFDTLKHYYRLTIFFMKQEIDLFKLYIFALSINIDLLTSRLNVLSANVKNTVTNISDWLTKFYGIHENQKNVIENEEKKKILENNYEEITILSNNADSIKNKVSVLIDESLKNMTHLYTVTTNTFDTFKKTRADKYGRPNEMMKLIFEFLKEREEQFESDHIREVSQQMANLENGIIQLEKTFELIATTVVYQDDTQSQTRCISQGGSNSTSNEACNFPNTFSRINNCVTNSVAARLDAIEVSNECSTNYFIKNLIPDDSEITESDDIIFDNLVIRSTLNNLLLEMQDTIQNVWMN